MRLPVQPNPSNTAAAAAHASPKERPFPDGWRTRRIDPKKPPGNSARRVLVIGSNNRVYSNSGGSSRDDNSDDNKDGSNDGNMGGSNSGGNSKFAERQLW